jgi:hypothetical protein
MQISRLLAMVAMFLSACLPPGVAFAGFFEDEERRTLGAQENCGPQPPQAGLFGSIFNSAENRALDNYNVCRQRNDRRAYLENKAEMQAIVDSTRESCKNAIRKMSSNPSTLSFDYGNAFDYLHGLNGSGVTTTDGGYSVKVSGSDVGGPFYVQCYMTKSFTITNVR